MFLTGLQICNTMRFFRIKVFLILLFFSFNVSDIYSQDTLKFSFNWLSPLHSWFDADSLSNKVILNFEGAKHNSEGIPVFSKLYPLADNCSEANVKVISYSIDTILNSDAYSHFSNIPENLSADSKILTENKYKRLQISIIPLIRKNGKILRIKSISVCVVKQTQVTLKKGIATQWVNSSVLSSGTWRKIAISKTGVFKLSFSEIKSLGFENPTNVKIYGNGGCMLPEMFSGSEKDDLAEIPIYFQNGNDGTFGEGDFILFYATGPVAWSYDSSTKKFVHRKHLYSENSYYFITDGANGLKMVDGETIAAPEDVSVSEFLDYAVHEENLYNLIKSGRTWYGEEFSTTTSRNFTFSFPNPVESSILSLEGEVLARSGSFSGFSISCTDNSWNQNMSAVNTSDEASNHADIRTFKLNSTLSGKDVSVKINFDKKGNSSAEGWLSFLRLNARRNLSYADDQLLFRDTVAYIQNKIVKYNINNVNSGLLIWDVTKLHNVSNVKYSLEGSVASFKSITDTLREFVVFDPAKAPTPDLLNDSVRIIDNQNLHALSNIHMVIISHKDFLSEAEELAEIHRTNDNLNVVTVTPDQIYNEFSSGIPDPAAYRNFLKMLYDRSNTGTDSLRYLLLFGDGSYMNLTSSQAKLNTNYILTFQSENSLRPVSSYVSDDYFGLLDDNESMEAGLLDIGIGRFPVSTKEQARGIINKIKSYISLQSAGNWRNNITFIADDEDNGTHMSQANQLASILETGFPAYNPIKIYSDAYPQVITSSGPRYPEVNKAIENTLNRGTLVVNYTGHGGEEGLAHEQIVKHEEVKNWGNEFYPLFVTATCEFSRYDDYERTSAGEDVLLNPNGGGIGLLTTTRLVYSGPNFVLNQQFYNNFAQRDKDGKYLKLGDILKKSKNASGSDINKLCFTLLGDPALQLAYPKINVTTTQINSQDVNSLTDTLKAYQEVAVKGIITDEAGNKQTNFNGTVYPSLFDKAQTVTTLSNDNEAPFTFNQQESLLYKGKTTVKNGDFEFSFVVPRDIMYNYGKGKLSYYATNQNIDATGYFDNFIIGGISQGNNTDNQGPDINLYLNDTNFKSGGLTNQYPILFAELTDESGINIAGTSIGHNIVATLDNNTSNSMILNNNFESSIDNYKSGSITYKLPKIEPGKHTLSLKAWDIFNNSATAEIAFEVADSSQFLIKNVYNYPNPFSERTYFIFEHNQPEKNFEAELQIYSVTGQLVNTKVYNIQSEGFSSGPIEYDGTGNKKLGRGIYIYRFILRYQNKEITSESKKMVISD